jgi:Replication-relaxation
MTVPKPSVRSLPAVAGAMLESLHAHRLLTARQLRELHAPDASLRWTQRVLAQLVTAGLVAFARAGRGGRRVYHLSTTGAAAVQHATASRATRRRARAAAQAAGALSAHTLAVNDVALAFVTAARQRGDECGPLAWRHEVAHATAPAAGGRRAELVIADALLTYLQHTGPSQLAVHYRFLELDRATQPTEALAAKLARYADLHSHTPTGSGQPAWCDHYPVFPEVLCVLAGAPRPALERRAGTVLALCAASPTLRAAPRVVVSLCLLEDLTAGGPWAAIFRRPQRPDRRVDWLGAPP